MANDPPNIHTYVVPDVSCDHCKRAIEEHVGQFGDVKSVTVDVNAKTVTVAGGSTNAIATAIASAGYAIASTGEAGDTSNPKALLPPRSQGPSRRRPPHSRP